MTDKPLLRSAKRVDRRRQGAVCVLVLALGILGALTDTRASRPGVGGQTDRAHLRQTSDQAGPGKWVPTRTPPGTVLAGSAACAECHRRESADYAHNPMSAALEPASTAMKLVANPGLTYRDGTFNFSITRDGDQSFYLVSDGARSIREPILFSFGQGRAGQTYILRHEGEYYESRVSYYLDIAGLDLTLGYRGTSPRTLPEALGRRLTRDEVTQCFGCHSTNAVSHSTLRLEKLIPGVTCESCHGPGGGHVAAGRAGRPNRNLIFNPGTLSGDEISQEFCGACHRGAEEVMTRNAEDGMFNVRFQPYRLFGSSCYSDDRRISCLGCHSPHEPLKRNSAHYDTACRSCHQPSRSVSAGKPRLCRMGTSDCASCHMPKIDLPGAHFKFTDHRIRIVRPGDPYPQ